MPPASMLLNNSCWSRSARTDEKNGPPGCHDSVDFAGNDRPHCFWYLGDHPNMPFRQISTEVAAFCIWSKFRGINVAFSAELLENGVAGPTSYEHKTKAAVS